MKVKDVMAIINRYADEKLAWEGDNSGLQVGNTEDEITKILLCVDITDNVINEAIANECNMIISHHPLLYRAVKNITNHDVKGQMITKLIKHDISLYSSHTSFDLSPYGMNSYIANQLDLKKIRFLDDCAENFYKIEVYVPKENAQELLNAMYQAGAGKIGNYENCSYSLLGEGTFKPLGNSNPYVGAINQIEHTQEIKIEALSGKRYIGNIIDAINQNHPYECPVYNIFEIKNTNGGIGLGVIGEFPSVMEAETFIAEVKKIFGCEKIKLTNNFTGRKIKTVAFCSGAGADYLSKAKSMGADVMITADCKWSDYLYAVEHDLIVVSPTHFESEHSFIQLMRDILNKEANDLKIIESKAQDIEVII